MKISGLAGQQLKALKKQQIQIREKIEIIALRELVKILDPEHDYIFDVQKEEFTKHKKGEVGDGKSDITVPGGAFGGNPDNPGRVPFVREEQQAVTPVLGISAEAAKLMSKQDDGS